MPQTQTVQFGLLEYLEEAVLEFPYGVPAFESDTRFLVLHRPETAPIIFLQSLIHAGLCFLTLPVLSIDPNYRLNLHPEYLEALELPPDTRLEIGGEIACLAILTIPPVGPLTANLLAPVVIRTDIRRGVQAIQVDSGYSHQHPILPEPERSSCS